MDIPSEDTEQIALASWLDRVVVDGRPLVWCHVPNEGERGGRGGDIARKKGVKSGVPDILIFTPPPDAPTMRGAALELKRRDESIKPTPQQLNWMRRLQAAGWATACAHGAAEAVEWLDGLGYVAEPPECSRERKRA